MITAVLERRVAKIEAEIRSLKSTMLKTRSSRYSLPTGKRLLAAVHNAERDVASGRILRGNLRELAK
jgi:hypothetical protein